MTPYLSSQTLTSHVQNLVKEVLKNKVNNCFESGKSWQTGKLSQPVLIAFQEAVVLQPKQRRQGV